MSQDLDAARAVIARLHPELGDSHDLTTFGEGFGAFLLESPGGVVVRIPKTPDAGRRMSVVAHVLPRIAGYLHVPLPVPTWLAPPAAGLPSGAMAYPLLSGKTFDAGATSPAIVDEIARLLAGLHAIDPVAAGIDLSLVPGRDATDAERETAIATCMPWLAQQCPAGTIDCLRRWWQTYRDDRVQDGTSPCLIHGDFWYGNLLTADGSGHLGGVLDWENLAYDDPAQDLATLLHGGPVFADRVLAAYARLRDLDAGRLAARRARHWEYREFSGLAAAIVANDVPEIGDALAKLRSGALNRCFTE